MSSRGTVPIYTNPFRYTDTIYPLNNYKIKQISNLIVSNPEKVLPPDWDPPGFISEEECAELVESMQSITVKFSYDDWYFHDVIEVLDGSHLYEWVNSDQGHDFFQLPELPDNYFYHVYCLNVVGTVHGPDLHDPFLWQLRYNISNDSYVLLKRTTYSVVADGSVSGCFACSYDKMCYLSYDVSTDTATASYSNIIGSLRGGLLAENFHMLDYGPNDINDPNYRYFALNVDGDVAVNFENSPDQVYFTVLLVPELKESLP